MRTTQVWLHQPRPHPSPLPLGEGWGEGANSNQQSAAMGLLWLPIAADG
ncbi:MAG: hypothetical protein HYY04_14565 [Chloroflexi bacterium]|nr:hypothetical protein [Chloroflexota bacterium]